MVDYKNALTCRACGSSELIDCLDLGAMPLPNKLRNSKEEKSKTYPLKTVFCEECALLQLSAVVNPEIMFSDYTYQSSMSETYRQHCAEMARTLKGMVQPFGKMPIVTDIASNDGCLLEEFRKEGFVVHGVEPSANLVQISRGKLISTVQEFWSEEFGEEYRKLTNRNNDVFTATNVFAHVDNIKGFLRGMKGFSPNQIVVIEVPHLLNLIKYNQFDTIYHEHLSYFLLLPILRLFKWVGFNVFRVDKMPIHGGSLRVYASENNVPVEKSVGDVINEELDSGVYEIQAYDDFAENCYDIQRNLRGVLTELKKQGKMVYGFGAAAKATIMLNSSGIDETLLPKIIDETPSKIGKFMPGVDIPIVALDGVDAPDYILINAWNFKDEIIRKTKHLGAKYIVAIPEVRIL